MALDITGKIMRVLPEQSGKSAKTGNDWKKGSFVLETESTFPKKVCFTVWGELTAQVKSLKEGQHVKVSFDVESREFNDRWYTDLKAWKIDPEGGESVIGSGEKQSVNTTTPSTAGAESFSASSEPTEDSSDDLPF